MELRIDPERVKWKHIKRLSDPEKRIEAFEQMVVLFAIDEETGEALSEDDAMAELDELSLAEITEMAGQLESELMSIPISPQTPSPLKNGAKVKGRHRSG